jgi:hypothetical protein
MRPPRTSEFQGHVAAYSFAQARRALANARAERRLSWAYTPGSSGWARHRRDADFYRSTARAAQYGALQARRRGRIAKQHRAECWRALSGGR